MGPFLCYTFLIFVNYLELRGDDDDAFVAVLGLLSLILFCSFFVVVVVCCLLS